MTVPEQLTYTSIQEHTYDISPKCPILPSNDHLYSYLFSVTGYLDSQYNHTGSIII